MSSLLKWAGKQGLSRQALPWRDENLFKVQRHQSAEIFLIDLGHVDGTDELAGAVECPPGGVGRDVLRESVPRTLLAQHKVEGQAVCNGWGACSS